MAITGDDVAAALTEVGVDDTTKLATFMAGVKTAVQHRKAQNTINALRAQQQTADADFQSQIQAQQAILNGE